MISESAVTAEAVEAAAEDAVDETPAEEAAAARDAVDETPATGRESAQPQPRTRSTRRPPRKPDEPPIKNLEDEEHGQCKRR